MTYAAFYIPQNSTPKQNASALQSAKMKDKLTVAFSAVNAPLQKFSISEMAENLTLQSASEFTQEYIATGLTMIIKQKPITNKTTLDAVFNGLAPAMNLAAAQAGYNSIQEFKNAVTKGNFNPTNMIRGISDGLAAVSKIINQKDNSSRYGEEIPIDLVNKFTRGYVGGAFKYTVQSGVNFNNGLHYGPLALQIEGTILDGGTYSAHEFSDKLQQVMQDKTPFMFKVGKKIFDNCVFTEYTPVREPTRGMMFTAKLMNIRIADVEMVNINDTNISSDVSGKIIVPNTSKGDFIERCTTKQVYQGVINVTP